MLGWTFGRGEGPTGCGNPASGTKDVTQGRNRLGKSLEEKKTVSSAAKAALILQHLHRA